MVYFKEKDARNAREKCVVRWNAISSDKGRQSLQSNSLKMVDRQVPLRLIFGSMLDMSLVASNLPPVPLIGSLGVVLLGRELDPRARPEVGSNTSLDILG